MKIDKKVNGNELILSLDGRLDTITSPELEKEVADLSNVKSLIIDFEKIEYISSAGLRVLLSCQKKMNQQGSMIIKNVKEEVKSVFDMTGFSDILIIE